MSLFEEYQQLTNPPVIQEAKEEEKKSDVRVIILTSSTDEKDKPTEKGSTVGKVTEWCDKHGLKSYVVYTDKALLDNEDNGDIFIYNIGEKGKFKIHKDNTVVLVRRGVVMHSHSLNLLSRLEKMRFCCFNQRVPVEVCEDKYRTSLKLVDSGIPIPRTSLIPNEDSIDYALEKIGGKFPVVVKTLTGTQGVGVFIIDSYESLKSTLQTVWKLSGGSEVLIQEKINVDFDIRIHVLGGKVIAAMRRNQVDKDFRTNVHLGGTTDKYKPSKEEMEIAIKSAKAVGCAWCGVDLMLSKKEPLVLEVNASPGTDGIEEVSGVDVTGLVMEYITNKDNWTITSQEVGVWESMKVDGLKEELVAKFDTGNSAKSSSLDAQDININGSTVTWKTNGQEMKGKVVDKTKIKSNYDSKHIVERPVVLLDVTFDGYVYKNVEFNLNDRSEKRTQILINRKFMERTGSVVNPARKFAITVGPKEVDKDGKARDVTTEVDDEISE